jgi:DNA repair photolyase
VLLAPVVPGFTTERSRLEATIRAIADHGAAFLGANVLYLKGGTKDHFMGFLRAEYPHLVQGYERLYPRAYAPDAYTSAVKEVIGVLRERYDNGVRIPRTRWSSDTEPVDAGGQEEFDWER